MTNWCRDLRAALKTSPNSCLRLVVWSQEYILKQQKQSGSSHLCLVWDGISYSKVQYRYRKSLRKNSKLSSDVITTALCPAAAECAARRNARVPAPYCVNLSSSLAVTPIRRFHSSIILG